MSRPDPVPAQADALPEVPDAALRRLMVGYDGSEASGVASSFGLWLAGKAKARLTLLHVYGNADQANEAASPELLAAAAEQRLDEERHWRHELENLRAYAAEDVSVETVLVEGHEAEALVEEARAREIDLVLVGSSGVGSVRGRFLGSVSTQVLEHAKSSVMIFHEGQAASPAHTQAVVVGIDGSEPSRAAAIVAAELARWLEAKLVLVYAYQPTVALAQHVSELRRELRRYGAELMKTTREGIAGDVVLMEELAEGRAREQLVAASEHHGPAVLVVGSRGRGGFKSLLLGSTSRWIANHASCPVVVARA